MKRAADLCGFTLQHWGERKRSKPKDSSGDNDPRRAWPIVMPVPDDAPAPPQPKPRRGEVAEDVHVYPDTGGRALFHIHRFRALAMGDRFSSRGQCRRAPNGSLAWVPYAQSTPLALYGLDRLPGATGVLLVEGERVSNAAQDLVPPGYAVLSIQGGTGKVDQQNFTPLRGVPVTAWPDHDPDGGGRKAMVTALRLAATAGAIVRGIVAVPEDFPAKFDLANEWPEADADPEARIRELIARAEPVETGGTQPLGRILSGADFTARHVPPAWLIDGIVQRSRLYTCTSRTNHGKDSGVAF